MPLLFVVSITAFGFVSLVLAQHGKPDSNSELPLFLNPTPEDVRVFSLSLMNRIAHGERVGAPEKKLVELGGAALPFVLPSLDSLRPGERELVAQALLPVAARIGLTAPGVDGSQATALVFWQHFWQDRAFDFRPIIVKRLAERLAAGESPLSRRDLLELDTFCLSELMANLGSLRTPADIARITRLLDVAAQVTQNDWRVPPGANLANTRPVVQRWREWWSRERAHYTALDGPLRIVALVSETQYGKWLASLLRGGLGTDNHGLPLLPPLGKRAPITLALILPALLFAHIVGPKIVRRLRQLPTAVRIGLLTGWFLPVCLPVVALFDEHERNAGSLWTAILVMLVWVTAPTFWQELAAQTKADELPESLRVLEPKAPMRAIFGLELSAVFSLAVVVETLFGLDGLGQMVAHALRQGDRNVLVTFALLGTLAASVLRLISDAAQKRRRAAPRLLVMRDSTPDVNSWLS